VPALDHHQVTSSLKRLAAQGATTSLIADAVVSTWQSVDAALAPVIGGTGVVALYVRSLHLVRNAHPWLAAAHQDPHTQMDLELLRSAVAQQEGASAAAGAGAHLQSLSELLGSLIGPSLAGQLLGPVWGNSLDGNAGKKISP